MKYQFQVTKIDEEKLKLARQNSAAIELTLRPQNDTAKVSQLLHLLFGSVWIFNTDYDPKKEGYKTKYPVVVSETDAPLFQEICAAIGAVTVKIGEHY